MARSSLLRPVYRLLLLGVTLLVAVPVQAQMTPARPAATPAPEADAFQAKLLLALSDADMVPSTYVDGKLGPPAGRDALSLVAFDGSHVAPVRVQTLPVSNTVTGPPAALTLTPDGRYALSAEGRGPRLAAGPEGTLAGLPSGRTLTVVDLADPQHPQVVQQLVGPQRVSAISVSADGTLVALAVAPAGDGTATPLWLYRFQNGRLLDGQAVPIPGWKAGDELVTAIFHPSRPLLALTNKTQRQLQLVEVRPAGSQWQLRPWGNAVAIEAGNLLTCFSPDGRYVFANGGPATPEPGEPLHGWVLSIRLDARPGAAGGPVHELVARARTGYVPEGLAVSPDGQLLVTVNLEQSFQPVGNAQRSRYASVSLFAIDPASGALAPAGDFAFDGMLPESAVFDRSSRRLAVANFGRLDEPTAGGSIDFWRVVGAASGPERLRLIKTNRSVPVQRGVHTLTVVR